MKFSEIESTEARFDVEASSPAESAAPGSGEAVKKEGYISKLLEHRETGIRFRVFVTSLKESQKDEAARVKQALALK